MSYIVILMSFQTISSINYDTVEVDPHSDLLHICIVKPKNRDVQYEKFFVQSVYWKNYTDINDIPGKENSSQY